MLLLKVEIDTVLGITSNNLLELICGINAWILDVDLEGGICVVYTG
jgi:hypothetical protein